MHHVIRRRRHRERGLALVLMSLVLVVLLVFAAFAVDFGQVYNARRQDQNAADAGALAGVQDIRNTTDSVIVQQVRDRVEQSLGVASGTINFNGCTGDTGLGTALRDASGNVQNCITRDGSRRLLRVRIPTRQVPAVFSSVVGRSSFSHSAFAIAGLQPVGYGSVLPFALFTSDGGHVCLRTDNPSSPVSPCAGSATGDSGLLNFGESGNIFLGTTADCSGNSTNAQGRLARNMAHGIDHDITLAPSAATPIVTDAGSSGQCSAYALTPNGTDTITGAGNPQGLGSGLFWGTSFGDGPARLQRTAQVPYSQRATIEGLNVDSTPLWSFIDPGMSHTTSNVPRQCEQSVFTSAVASINNVEPDALRTHLSSRTTEVRLEKLLERCFALYITGTWTDGGYTQTRTAGDCNSGSAPCTGVLFGRNSVVEEPEVYDIQYTPRFAYVPLSHQGLGANTISFAAFRPIFIQRLCLGNQQCNHGTWSPGTPYDDAVGGTTNDVQAVSGFAFHRNMLPGQLGSDDAPFRLNANLVVRLVR